MLQDIKADEIARAIRRDVDLSPDKNNVIRRIEYNTAEQFGIGGANTLHCLLEPQIQAWINNTEIPEFVCGHWSLRDIQEEWNCSFFFAAMAMTKYMTNHDSCVMDIGNHMSAKIIPTKKQKK
jgi:hypothetical protein